MALDHPEQVTMQIECLNSGFTTRENTSFGALAYACGNYWTHIKPHYHSFSKIMHSRPGRLRSRNAIVFNNTLWNMLIGIWCQNHTSISLQDNSTHPNLFMSLYIHLYDNFSKPRVRCCIVLPINSYQSFWDCTWFGSIPQKQVQFPRPLSIPLFGWQGFPPTTLMANDGTYPFTNQLTDAIGSSLISLNKRSMLINQPELPNVYCRSEAADMLQVQLGKPVPLAR